MFLGRSTHHCSYNKREEDFESREAYNDYLEEREDISEREEH